MEVVFKDIVYTDSYMPEGSFDKMSNKRYRYMVDAAGKEKLIEEIYEDSELKDE